MITKLDKEHFLIKELIGSYRNEWQTKSGQRDKERRKYFYFSDVSKCNRELYYCFINPEKKRTIADKTLVLFNAGNLHHEDIQYRFKRHRLIDSSRDLEFGLEDWEIEASGRLDSFVQDNGGLAITEIKTKNPYGFQNEEPEQAEIDQLLWYIFAAKNSKSLKERNILNYGYILYIEGWPMSDLPFAGWKIEYDDKRIVEIRERFKNLKQSIDAQSIPQRPYERDSIKCQYCRFADFCWQGIPKPEQPKFTADETMEKPEQELVNSMASNYIRLKAEEAKVAGELEQCLEILMKYFKATGTEQIDVNDRQIIHEFSKQTNLNIDFLKAKLADKWILIAKPQVKLIQEAIKAGQIDPEIFERSKEYSFQDKLRIKKIKEA